MTEPHPTYPNPTITDAVCHVQFEPSPQSGWQISRPTAFLQAVQGEYPIVQSSLELGAAIQPTPAGLVPQVLSGTPQLRLSSEDQARFIAIGDRHFAFGQKAPYRGWNEFRACFLKGWQELMPLAKPQVVSRISVRYVNAIPRTAKHSHIADWLQPTRSIPETLVSSASEPFVLRLESWISTKSLLIITIGLAQQGSTSPFMFDIDRISTELASPGPEELIGHVDRLHEDVWHEFSSACTPYLLEHLKGPSA